MVYRYITLTIAQAFAAEDSYLLSEMQISLAVQNGQNSHVYPT